MRLLKCTLLAVALFGCDAASEGSLRVLPDPSTETGRVAAHTESGLLVGTVVAAETTEVERVPSIKSITLIRQ